MSRSDFCDYSDGYIVMKRTTDLGVVGNNAMTLKRCCIYKLMLHSGHAYQKSITHSSAM